MSPAIMLTLFHSSLNNNLLLLASLNGDQVKIKVFSLPCPFLVVFGEFFLLFW